MSIPTDRDLLVKAAGNLLNAAHGFEDLNPTLARRLAAAVINDQSFGVDYLSRTQMQVNSLAGAQQVAVPQGYALVPIEPTRQMIVDLMCTGLRHAEYISGCSPSVKHLAEGYTAMLKAAPQPVAYVPKGKRNE